MMNRVSYHTININHSCNIINRAWSRGTSSAITATNSSTKCSRYNAAICNNTSKVPAVSYCASSSIRFATSRNSYHTRNNYYTSNQGRIAPTISNIRNMSVTSYSLSCRLMTTLSGRYSLNRIINSGISSRSNIYPTISSLFPSIVYQPSRHQQQHRSLNYYTNRSSSCLKIAPRSTSSIVTLSSSPFQYKLYNHDVSYGHTMIGSTAIFSSRPPSSGGGSRIASGIGMIGAATVLFGKTKYILAALKVTKLASLGSMVFTIGTYSMFFGFPYAVGMVGLILVHEMGHAAVMHYKNVPFSPMVFIPFMGAVIAMKDYPRDAWDDAMIAIGGPLAGSLGAGVVAVGAHMTHSQLLYALADFGFMINLFNMLPIGSMDGGRIAGALSKWVGVGGIGFGSYLAVTGVVQNPLFYLILLSGGYETFQRFYNPYHLPPNFYKISTTQRVTLTTSYVGLIVSLLIAMDINQRYRKPPEVLIREKQMMEKSWDFQ